MLIESIPPDRYLSVKEVARLCSAGPRPVREEQVYGWIRSGVKAVSGERVKLRPIRLPKGTAVHPSDLRRFLAAINEDGYVEGLGMVRNGRLVVDPDSVPAITASYPPTAQRARAKRPAAQASNARGPGRQPGLRLQG